MSYKILLIEPFNKNFVRVLGKVYMSKLTLSYVASYIPEDIEVEILDENTTKIDFNTDADFIFITALTVTSIRAYQIADKFRQNGKKVVIGGIHATMLPDEAIKHADAVLVGECENIINTLISDLKNGNLKKFYHADRRMSLNNYKPPRRELVDIKKYRFVQSIETGRGCPFNCDFCSTTKFFGAKQRFRPIEDVVNEIKSMKPKSVFFTDDNIVCNKKRAKELFKAIKPLNINWIGQGSIEVARDPELLKLMRESGCYLLLVGFESLDPENIGEDTGKTKINKVEDYAKNIKTLHQYGIGIIGCFVFGFDNDDLSVFKRTYDFIMKNNIDVVQVSMLTPFPGTKLYEKMDNENRVLTKDWSKFDAVHVTYKPKNMSPEELKIAYTKLSNKIYSIPNIIKRSIKSLFYTKRFKLSLVVFPLVNYVYRKLFRLGNDEKVWHNSKKSLFETIKNTISDIKKIILTNKSRIHEYFANNNQNETIYKKVKKIFHQDILFIRKLNSMINRGSRKAIIKEIRKFISVFDKRIKKINTLNLPEQFYNLLNKKRKRLEDLYKLIKEVSTNEIN